MHFDNWFNRSIKIILTFQNPIQHFTLPFKDLSNWFEHRVIIQKREQIADFITELAIKFSEDGSVNFPTVKFPKYSEANSSDNEDNSWSRGSSSISLNWPKVESPPSQPSENPYEFVTTRKATKYKLNKNLFDTKTTFYKRNSTLRDIKKPSCLKGISEDLSDYDYKSTVSESDTEIFDVNNFASTSKTCLFDVEIESMKPKRPVRKAVTRASEIKEKARIIKGRKRNEDSTFHKKNTSTKFPGKGRVLGSSPWMSKHSNDSDSISITSAISSETFYGYSIKNVSELFIKYDQFEYTFFFKLMRYL